VFINSLQTFGKIPNYLHHQQLQAEAPQKEIETNQFKPKGHYITGSEREALLKVTSHVSAIFNVRGANYTHILYQQKQDWQDRMCKLVRRTYHHLNYFNVLFVVTCLGYLVAHLHLGNDKSTVNISLL
jgi:hypothetical protein